MKYIRMFEDVDYKVGDYVLIYAKILKKEYIESLDSFLGAKIINIDGSEIPYLLLLSDGMDFWASFGYIERKLTSEEIELYEIKLSENKYNL